MLCNIFFYAWVHTTFEKRAPVVTDSTETKLFICVPVNDNSYLG